MFKWIRAFLGFGKQQFPVITVHEAHTRVQQGDDSVVLIDVREGFEYRHTHAQHARNVPLSQLGHRLHDIPRDRDVLVICQTGHRSGIASQRLVDAGFTNITNVQGGTGEWMAQRLPTG